MLKGLGIRLLGAASVTALACSCAQAQGIQLDGIIVTTTKTIESAIDALSGSSVVDRELLDQQFQADRASEFLRALPGVTTQDKSKDTAQSINIRGLQDFGRVNVLDRGRAPELPEERSRRQRCVLHRARDAEESGDHARSHRHDLRLGRHRRRRGLRADRCRRYPAGRARERLSGRARATRPTATAGWRAARAPCEAATSMPWCRPTGAGTTTTRMAPDA